MRYAHQQYIGIPCPAVLIPDVPFGDYYALKVMGIPEMQWENYVA